MKSARDSAPQIHRLRRDERPMLCEHLMRLDPDSRFQRFGMITSDEVLREYAAHCFDNGDLVFGYFADGVLRGAGELHGLGLNTLEETAEAAFSVEKDWRGLGVGAALMALIVETAQNIGVRTMHLTCLARNRAMQSLVRRYESQLCFEADPTTGRLVAHRKEAPDCLTPIKWRQTLDADGFHARIEFPQPTSMTRRAS